MLNTGGVAGVIHNNGFRKKIREHKGETAQGRRKINYWVKVREITRSGMIGVPGPEFIGVSREEVAMSNEKQEISSLSFFSVCVSGIPAPILIGNMEGKN